MTRIKEDIRFYLPADPYYYRVDNLPLEDLLQNDIKLQAQIDDILSAETGTTIQRSGFLELKPYIDVSLPGMVSVNAGNFIGRVQGSAGGNLIGQTDFPAGNGIYEIGDPPTEGATNGSDGDYNIETPNLDFGTPPGEPEAAKSVGRTSVIEFKGGSVAIDAFDATDFEWALTSETLAPAGRIDLIGITTMNGAFDDPTLPGNSGGANMFPGDGYARLAVVKGAGITTAGNRLRVQVIGEKFITVGMPQTRLNPVGRDIDGNVVPNPEFGTVPSPDDIVNVCFSRPDISTSLSNWAQSNSEANFFLPLAYVFVPATHVQGAPIPQNYLKDIRPMFRTAELTLAERQSIAASVNPSLNNPLASVQNVNDIIDPLIDGMQGQIDDMQGQVGSIRVERQVWLSSPKQVLNGKVSNGANLSLEQAINIEDRGKRIVSVNHRIRPHGMTGDINPGWIGLKRGATNLWHMNWGNDIIRRSSIMAGVVSFIAPVNAGTLSVTTAATGTRQSIYWYVDGYVVEENI